MLWLGGRVNLWPTYWAMYYRGNLKYKSHIVNRFLSKLAHKLPVDLCRCIYYCSPTNEPVKLLFVVWTDYWPLLHLRWLIINARYLSRSPRSSQQANIGHNPRRRPCSVSCYLLQLPAVWANRQRDLYCPATDWHAMAEHASKFTYT